jgi:hypothetical protein
MSRRAIGGLLAGFLWLAPLAAKADSIRCDGGIVSVGDSKLDLLAKCGPPALQEAEPVATANADASLLIERWTYNFGPQRFLQIVSLQGGRVIAVERGSYGYALPEPPRDAPGPTPIPRALCEPDTIHVGDRTFDVLVKCGEPVSRDLRQGRTVLEVWTYDFGQHRFVRSLEFQGGRLVRIKSGGYGYSK